MDGRRTQEQNKMMSPQSLSSNGQGGSEKHKRRAGQKTDRKVQRGGINKRREIEEDRRKEGGREGAAVSREA